MRQFNSQQTEQVSDTGNETLQLFFIRTFIQSNSAIFRKKDPRNKICSTSFVTKLQSKKNFEVFFSKYVHLFFQLHLFLYVRFYIVTESQSDISDFDGFQYLEVNHENKFRTMILVHRSKKDITGNLTSTNIVMSQIPSIF